MVWMFKGVCRGEPGSLLYDLYEVMHIVFNIPVRFKGNVEGKVFVYIILKSPNPLFLRLGWMGGFEG